MDELLAEFIAETRDTLAPLASEIVVWEADPADTARLDAIFRFVHTVKGSCGFLDLPRLERLSHAAEGALAQVRSGARAPDGALVSAVLAIIDRIGEMVDALDAGADFPDHGDETLILALEPGARPAPGPAPASRAAPATAPAAPRGPRTPSRSVRLPVELLDRMMGGVSDMVLARNELARQLRDAGIQGHADAAFERLSGCVAEMRDAITRTRMQRIDGLFAALPRMVRDLSVELGRQVELAIEGGDVELDREMIEMLRDPLTHIVRNSIDHGIEPAAERIAAGKPAAGALRIAARQSGNQILIEIGDDGRGIDAERLVAKAIAGGVIGADEAARLGHEARLELIFAPGLSTAREITAISGRGVGMDVVRANIERIGGRVDIDSRFGRGLRLTLRVPLTLTIIPALTISVGGQDFALPRSAIDEIVRGDSGGVVIERAGGARFAAVRGVRMPLIDLAGVLGIDRAPCCPILVVLRPAGADRCALAVDAVHDHEELVVKPAAPALMATGLYAGTTLPDTGRPMLLLDPAGIAAAAGITAGQAAPAPAEPEQPDAAELVPTLLFRGCDQAERAIRLGVVERIADVAAHQVRHSGGRLRLAHDGRVLPVYGTDAAPPEGTRLRVLLMDDGKAALAFAIGAVIDIVAAGPPAAGAPAGPIAGVLLVEGRQVELLDPFWLFADALGGSVDHGDAAIADRPLCVLGDRADPWTREVLRPLIEAAGYRVAFAGDPGSEGAAFVIAGDDAPVAGPAIRLRSLPAASGPGDASIYRYDRAALLSALGRAGKAAR